MDRETHESLVHAANLIAEALRDRFSLDVEIHTWEEQRFSPDVFVELDGTDVCIVVTENSYIALGRKAQ